MRAFAWKRIVLDKQGAPYKKDLTGLDPAYQGKEVVWKGLRESDKITLAMVEGLFPEKKREASAQRPSNLGLPGTSPGGGGSASPRPQTAVVKL